MKHKLSLFLLLFVVVSSCQNELIQENLSQPRKASVIDPKICNSRNLGMPFTEPDELERLTENNENVIDYRIARYLATVELLAGANFECDYGYLYAHYNFRGIDVKGLTKEAARTKYMERSDTADYGLAACFYQESVPLWWGEWQFPLYHGGLNRGFDTATDGEYKVKFTCKPYDWIVSREEPVIIGVNCDHYLVAFGTGTTHKKNGKIKDKYFAIVDNGYTTEAHCFHPYMRKHNGWNLHYGMKRND